ncbi:hypothetical protein AYJ57_07805 [Salipiger sp. CCB-MM3]|uniref:hypothetical protein n=1 Tax=Salipiger sp. CCB-MM3 TaxID=1792508 RepID=UPI00080AB4FA|nr:hypothetical protein [Salipiger sp. CCB-MM3]ANT60274.1 hypothetical protein AYJ57_07805 [Salipiger sp. CCB-MM3]
MPEVPVAGAGGANALLNRLYVSQMLQFSGAFSARGNFGGGAGEGQFSSYLREEFATKIADNLQILPQEMLSE